MIGLKKNRPKEFGTEHAERKKFRTVGKENTLMYKLASLGVR